MPDLMPLMPLLAPILADITVEEMRGWLTLVNLAGMAGFAFLLGFLCGMVLAYRTRRRDRREQHERLKHLGGPFA